MKFFENVKVGLSLAALLLVFMMTTVALLLEKCAA